MVNPDYVPRSVHGFVWLSNYGDMKRFVTREDCIVCISTEYDIPIEDIYVEPFRGMWAGFVRETHAAVARDLQARLDDYQAVFKALGWLR